MDIIAICNEHKLNLYKDVKSFGKFKKSLESLHQCETKYYVIKKREYSLPENYDSVYYNKKTKTLDFFIQEDVEKTMKVKKSFYDMNEEQIQETYDRYCWSWNVRDKIFNKFMFNLGKHSQHHVNENRHYPLVYIGSPFDSYLPLLPNKYFNFMKKCVNINREKNVI